MRLVLLLMGLAALMPVAYAPPTQATQRSNVLPPVKLTTLRLNAR